MELSITFINLIITTIVGFVVSGTLTYLVKFVREQKQVNHANALANRSMQRDVLYRYFHKVVELGEPLTPEEYKHVNDCWNAYHASGNNGSGDLMWDKIREYAQIETGRKE